jgi:hypothetical protein
MISTEALFPALIACLSAWLITGFATMAWGSRLPRKGDWLAAIPLLLWLAFSGVALSELSERGFEARSWIKGWIGPREDVGSIAVGVIQDPLGLTLGLLAGILVAAYLFDRGLYANEKSPERCLASLSVAGSGVGLALISGTPWLALCGLGLAVLGGFLCLGSRWESESEAIFSVRFAWERSWGLLLAAIGLCLLAASRGEISFVNAGSFSAHAGSPLADRLGAILMVSGLFLQLGSLPFVGPGFARSTVLMPVRLITTQIFPAWAALVLLIRFRSELEQLGIFPAFGWVGFASAFLGLAVGLLQPTWRAGLASVVSAGFCLALGALAFAGPRPAVAILIGASLGGLAMATAGHELEGEASRKAADRKRALWCRVGSGFGAASLGGMAGFVALTGFLQVGIRLFEEPPALALFLIVLLLLAMLAWSVHWRILKLPAPASQPRVMAIALPFFWSILGLAVIWTGSASGGLVPGGADDLMRSLLDLFFGGPVPSQPDDRAVLSVGPIAGGAALIGLFIGYWTTGRKHDSWEGMRESFPRFSGFLESGYRVDAGVGRIRDGVVRLANGAEWLFSSRLWQRWIPNTLSAGVRRSGSFAASADDWIHRALSASLRNSVDVPARLLQAIQSGDVRWYLFFAIGSGIAMLLHFSNLGGR